MSTITLSAGIVSCSGRALLRFGSNAEAAVWLFAHGWGLVGRVEFKKTPAAQSKEFPGTPAGANEGATR